MEIDDLEVVLRNLQPKIPIDKQLWPASTVASYLRVSVHTVLQRYARLHGFPRARHLPSDSGKGHKRWKAIEIIKWAEKL